MTDKEQINDLARVLDKAKIDALCTIGSLNNGFGQWYAKAVYNAGYGKVDEYKAEIERLNNEYNKAFERLKSQQREIDRLKEENDEYKRLNENIFYVLKIFIESLEKILKEYEK